MNRPVINNEPIISDWNFETSKKFRWKSLLVILNPFIWLINNMNHESHMMMFEHCQDCYELYDFSKDLKYFKWNV